MVKAEQILRKWLTAVNNGKIKEVLSLYNEEAVLIPTFSNKVLNTKEKINDYFEQLGSREELKVTLHDKTVKVQQADRDISIVSGIYAWQFLVEKEALLFEARFSFILNLNSERPVIHHHSSQIPRML